MTEKGMIVLAIVPARSGSKSIPKKNIRSFAGHPLLAYSIAAGLQASAVDRVVVSTEDEGIAGISLNYGAEVPFLRPEALAEDGTPDLPVFKHALKWLAEEEGYRPEIVVQLRPTSPVRPVDCVDRAVSLLVGDMNADSVRGVVPSGQNPYKMWRITGGGAMQPLLEGEYFEAYNMPRQDLPQTYWQTGHVDAIRTSTILEKDSMTGDRILPLVLERSYTVDIDTEADWARAEWLVDQAGFDMVRPKAVSRSLPSQPTLLVLDFDGVLTDNRVWVDEGGRESVAAHRGDGWGIARLKERGVEVMVLSTEDNPVVEARCRKLGVSVVQGVKAKGETLQAFLAERKIPGDQVIFVGNDVNDLPCFSLVGYALAVSDAHPDVIARADAILSRPGGRGAVRELCDRILEGMEERGR